MSNLAFTVASRLPQRATVVGISNAIGDDPDVADEIAGGLSSVIWLLKFWTAHTRPALEQDAVDVGTSAPAIGALAPVVGSTV